MKRYNQLSFLIVAALLLACGVAMVFICRHALAPPPPSLPESTLSAVINVKSVAPKPPTILKSDQAIVSASIAAGCGSDPATAARYEARNDALRAIARERNLASNDVAALMDYLASTNDVLHTERLVALKNDVMNLLRRQEPPPEI